jgi:hypothetical protein
MVCLRNICINTPHKGDDDDDDDDDDDNNNNNNNNNNNSGTTTSLLKVLAYSATSFLDAFCPIIYFHILKSSFISFSHLIFGLSANFIDIGCQSYDFMTILSSVIWCTWPNQLNLWTLV